MIEVYTSHWRSPLLEDVDAQIVSISRGEPKWRLPFAYRRLRSLAPGDEAWNAEDRKAFEAAYVRQLEEIGAAAILCDLERIGGGRPCICLCWERSHEEFCHRWLLAAFLEREAGIVVPELAPSMLKKRPDAQPALFDYREERA